MRHVKRTLHRALVALLLVTPGCVLDGEDDAVGRGDDSALFMGPPSAGGEALHNRPPVCVATLTGEAACGGASLTLGAGKSHDLDGDPLTFAWSVGPCDFDATLSAPTARTTQLKTGAWSSCAAACTVQLEVSDGRASTTCTVQTGSRDLAPQLSVPAPASVECVHGEASVPADAVQLDAFFDGASADDPCQSGLTVTDDAPAAFPLGKTTVSFATKDPCGHARTGTSTVTVTDTQGPVFTPGPTATLWPPNHKYVTLTLSGCGKAVDACHGALDLDKVGTITSVTSDEPEDVTGAANGNSGKGAPGKPNAGKLGPDQVGGGDGATLDDIVLVDAHTVKVRAERDGTRNGRVYTIAFMIKDPSGVSTQATCQATVPHDQGTGSQAIADPPAYVVVSSQGTAAPK